MHLEFQAFDPRRPDQGEVHDHEVVPVSIRQTRIGASTLPTRHVDEVYGPIRWLEPLVAIGKISDVALHGNFTVNLRFESTELTNWLRCFIAADPVGASRFLLVMQGEAITALAEKSKPGISN